MNLLEAIASRRSRASVTGVAPGREELLPLIAAAASVADHASLRPWRLIELRDDARERLGAAFVAATGLEGKDAAKLAAKPLRASLLLAVVVVHKPNLKVPDWEQDAAAAGVAHLLSLLLHDAGWGVMWRTGPQTRSAPVRRLHQLADNEELLGWLYVGGVPETARDDPRTPIDPQEFISHL